MAVTFTTAKVVPNADFTEGNRRRRVRDVTATGGYTTGGDVLAASLFSLKRIDELIIHGVPTDGTIAYPANYIYSTNKLKFYETASGASTGLDEKGSGESMTTTTFRATAVGV